MDYLSLFPKHPRVAEIKSHFLWSECRQNLKQQIAHAYIVIKMHELYFYDFSLKIYLFDKLKFSPYCGKPYKLT